jgi:hypothetical protein
MTIRRTEEVDPAGRRRVVIEEPAVVDETADAGVETRQQVVQTSGSAVDAARGAIRSVAVLVLFVTLVFETLLAFRFGFLLGGANPNQSFVDFIYDASGWLVDPFEGIASRSTSGDGVFDPATLIAMAVIGTAAMLITLALWAISSVPSTATAHTETSQTVFDAHAARERDRAHDLRA